LHPNFVSFDIAIKTLRYVGADNKRRAWQNVFAAYSPIAYEIRDLNVTTHGAAAVESPSHLRRRLPNSPQSAVTLLAEREREVTDSLVDLLIATARMSGRRKIWPALAQLPSVISLMMNQTRKPSSPPGVATVLLGVQDLPGHPEPRLPLRQGLRPPSSISPPKVTA